MALEPSYSDFEKRLTKFDFSGTRSLVNSLEESIVKGKSAITAQQLARILLLLRNYRMYDLIIRLGEHWFLHQGSSLAITQHVVQSLLEKKMYRAASLMLDSEIKLQSNQTQPPVFAQLKGLQGRLYKQKFIETKQLAFLQQAVAIYYQEYESDKGANSWHGINALALACYARRHGIAWHPLPDIDTLGNEILAQIVEKQLLETATYFDYATAGEACLALGQPGEALEWMSGYARMAQVNAFALASTLRQLQEVWELTVADEAGQLLLPMLQAALLQRQGGVVMLDPSMVIDQTQVAAAIEDEYQKRTEDRITTSQAGLEKTFGEDSFATYSWYKTGLDCCRSVVRIGRRTDKGIGSGFILPGQTLHASLGGQWVLVTNAHVIAEPSANTQAISPQEATLIFEQVDAHQSFKLGNIIYSSPPTDLDVTIVGFEKNEHQLLDKFLNAKKIKSFKLAAVIPPINQRMYIIGHPFGGTLQISLQDNYLLDQDGTYLHYRTPTEPGSSGSPVFNDNWELVALHHAGSATMRKLKKKPGVYQANEGIAFAAIKEALTEALK